MKSRYKFVLFDLDGTLIASAEGVIEAFEYALSKFGIDPGDRESMKKLVGPVLKESFQKVYHFDSETVEEVLRYYHESYETSGIYKVPLFEGVDDMLSALQDAGKILLVVTAKQQEMAESILRYVGIDRYFRAVVGPNRSESRTDKAAMIKKALSWLELHESAGSPAAEHTVMVGDRFFDIEGAVQDGVDSIGVLYGYGDRQELEKAGATWFAETPEEVVRIIKGTS